MPKVNLHIFFFFFKLITQKKKKKKLPEKQKAKALSKSNNPRNDDTKNKETEQSNCPPPPVPKLPPKQPPTKPSQNKAHLLITNTDDNNNNNNTVVKEGTRDVPVQANVVKPTDRKLKKTLTADDILAKGETGETENKNNPYGLSVEEMINPTVSMQRSRTLVPLARKSPPAPTTKYKGKYGKKIEFVSGEFGSGRSNDQVGTLALLPSRLGNGWIYCKLGMYQVTLEESARWNVEDEKETLHGKGKLKEGGPCLFDSNDGKFAVNVRPINRLLDEMLIQCMNAERTMTLYNASFYVLQTQFDDQNRPLQNELISFDKFELSEFSLF
ncbi:hypothetical protein RFI_24566 [Reticulomyxa filosa]|uniref:Uncharacterized protein n=1 Tax=Reticulomyxa filosa TaxID=46433 RepID=X6MGN4_RETFI|nr:hypothetical protein RFI_24566 [Reticulomyxa filosa]|eukprot:ETO12811.1 hypothetical protein RFI_24566 [Reticulomyxa filosa]